MPDTITKKSIHHEIPEHRSINITALIDVVFQLLIFFMLASSLVKPNQIEIDLPTSSSGVKSQENQVLSVRYSVKDSVVSIWLNESSLESLDALRAAMGEYQTADGQTPPRVDLVIERTVPYQNLVDLMDAVREAGFGKFSLLTLAPGSIPAAPAEDADSSPASATTPAASAATRMDS